jgi:hypothetical protein
VNPVPLPPDKRVILPELAWPARFGCLSGRDQGDSACSPKSARTARTVFFVSMLGAVQPIKRVPTVSLHLPGDWNLVHEVRG